MKRLQKMPKYALLIGITMLACFFVFGVQLFLNCMDKLNCWNVEEFVRGKNKILKGWDSAAQ
jgi:hypothetical protein